MRSHNLNSRFWTLSIWNVPNNTFPANNTLIQEIKALMDVLNKRDESIQFLMKIMDNKFENVWKIPWELGQIIHDFTWNKEDVSAFCFVGTFLRNIMHSSSLCPVQIVVGKALSACMMVGKKVPTKKIWTCEGHLFECKSCMSSFEVLCPFDTLPKTNRI